MKLISICKKITLTVLLSLIIQPIYAATNISQGDNAPLFSVNDINGNKFDLKIESAKSPIVLVFYRGGWCPYCNVQLRQLQAKITPELKKYNAKLVAISVDRMDEALKTKKSESLEMTVISDPDAKLIKQYGIAYKVPDKLVKKYKQSYKIDLEKSSGKKHHIIAIPSVFIVDQKAKITFAYKNEDYKVRAQIEDILKGLKKTKR